MITPTKKQLLQKAYQHTMDVSILNMKAPIRWIDQYVSESVTGFGTAADEKVRSRKDYHKLIQDARNQSKAMPYKAVIKTAYRPKMQGENQAVFNDEILVSIGTKKNAHHITLWMSTVFQWADNKWQLILFHGSMPNFNTSSEDTFHIEEAKKRVKELEQKVAEKTAELKERNRELEIETALEKVRAVAMGMKQAADMLRICKIISEQLAKLGVQEIRNVQTAIFNNRGTYMNYEYYAKHNKEIVTEVAYTGKGVHIEQKKFVQAMLALGKGIYSKQFKGAQLEKWHSYQKGTNQLADKYLLKAHSLNYYWYSLVEVALGFSTYYPLSENELTLYKKFRNVFALAYKRYIDIEKATAQAREAQIEAALERVRSKAMAMHTSKDILDTATTAFEELSKIGIYSIRCGVGLFNKTSVVAKVYAATKLKNGKIQTIEAERNTNEHASLRRQIKAWQEQKDLDEVLKGKELASYYNNAFFKEAAVKQKATIKNSTEFGYYFAFADGLFYSWTDKEYTLEEKKVLDRFRSIIALTFRRFLDLQKAEAQAREAQIEASLEKVRSVAMSMHHSNELLNICEAIYAELLKLGITELRNTMINIHNDSDETFLNYDYSAYGGRAVTKYGYHIHPIINHLVMQCRSAQDAFVDVAFVGEEFEAWRSFRKSSGEKDDKRLNNITHLHYYFYSIGIGSIGVSTFESIDEQKLALLKRFRNVFQLAYQRFTDLAAAEAQAREAQIETALERVRSRTMAMQKSSELADTVQIMFEEFRSLQTAEVNATMARGFITTIQPEIKQFDLWITEIDGTKVGARFKIEFNEPTTGAAIYKAWKQKNLLSYSI